MIGSYVTHKTKASLGEGIVLDETSSVATVLWPASSETHTYSKDFLITCDRASNVEITTRLHERRFATMSRRYVGVRLAGAHNQNRVTHCWSCMHDLLGSRDLECRSCGWLVCLCGACGCGYEGPHG